MSSYDGWIPNVLGRLSYSIAGQSGSPSRIVFEGDLEDAGINFICYQKRNLSDTSVPFLSEWPWPRLLVDRYVYGKDGRFYFACYLTYDKVADELHGRAYCFVRSEWERPKAALRVAMTTLHDAHLGTPFDFINSVDARVSHHAHAACSLRIRRNGHITLEMLRTPQDNQLLMFRDAEQAFASQLYFFVRDLLHTHKFHSRTTDRILDVYRDAGWQHRVNYALARKSIRLRRNAKALALHRSLGILSYLKSFRSSVMTESERSALPFSIDEFVSSVNHYQPLAKIEEDRYFLNRAQTLINRFLAICAVLITAAVTIGGNDRVYDKLPKDQQGWVDFAIINIIPLVAVGIVALTVVAAVLPRPAGFREKNARNLSRIAVTRHRKRFGGGEIAVGSILAVLAWVWIAALYF